MVPILAGCMAGFVILGGTGVAWWLGSLKIGSSSQGAAQTEWHNAKYRLVFVVPSRSMDKYITGERKYGLVLK